MSRERDGAYGDIIPFIPFSLSARYAEVYSATGSEASKSQGAYQVRLQVRQ
ncbi:MAG: hypothetical protein QNJ53_05225 [Pleurocapsa sp. MO_192.B19]|nr:hypothetical protein [Pleurocapsa sp. MO_192.B19]